LQTLQGIVLETLRAIQLFFIKYAARLGAVVKSGTQRQLDKAVADLEHLGSEQATSETVMSAAPKAAELRHDLIEKHMKPILRLASVNLPRTPELAKLAIPRGKPTPEKLVVAARGIGNTVAPYAQTFIDAGMPETFLADLESAAQAVADCAAQRKGSTAVGKKATSGIAATISRGKRVITGLDALVTKELDPRSADDELIRAEWKSVKKVRKTASRPVVPPEPVPIPPAPTSTGGAP
jgi:hypothetical protein